MSVPHPSLRAPQRQVMSGGRADRIINIVNLIKPQELNFNSEQNSATRLSRKDVIRVIMGGSITSTQFKDNLRA
jgi:hypothetical protein